MKENLWPQTAPTQAESETLQQARNNPRLQDLDSANTQRRADVFTKKKKNLKQNNVVKRRSETERRREKNRYNQLALSRLYILYPVRWHWAQTGPVARSSVQQQLTDWLTNTLILIHTHTLTDKQGGRRGAVAVAVASKSVSHQRHTAHTNKCLKPPPFPLHLHQWSMESEASCLMMAMKWYHHHREIRLKYTGHKQP